MMQFMIRHLLESTLFCLLLSGLACCLQKTATATVRHSIWLIGASKFAIPSVLLAKTGAAIAFFWPAASWLSFLANKVQAALQSFFALFPGDQEAYPLLLLWSLGTAALFTTWLIRLRASHTEVTLSANEEQAALRQAQHRLPARMPIELRSSTDSSSPALRGIWRPTIIIPKGLAQSLTPAEFQAVLLHELAHARRLDNLTAVFVHCLVCLFWFHPLLWLVERRLQVERERACDELVLARGTEPAVYAAGILKVCKFHLSGAAAVAGFSAMTGTDLTRRLEFILDRPSFAPAVHVPRLLVAGLAILMTLCPIAGGYCQQCASSGQTEPKGVTK
jgi:bla regulator protein BlaR1